MKKQIALALVVLLTAAFACSRKTSGSRADAVAYNPYVEAFSSGKISRQTPVYIILNQPIDNSVVEKGELGKYFKVTPSVDGTFSMDDENTVVFRPSSELKQNTSYTFTADLKALFGAQGADGRFAFSVTTLPVDIRGRMESFDVDKDDDNLFTVNTSFYTTDKEKGKLVESLVRLSENADTTWRHAPDGKKHELIVKGLRGGKELRTLTISVAPNKYGVNERELVQAYIPAADVFDLYDIRYVSQPERCIELTFTKPLNEKQTWDGLVYITGQDKTTRSTDGNKIKLYTTADKKGNVQVVINRSLETNREVKLGKDIQRTVELPDERPAVRFIGNGVVIPESENLTVPFQSIYLRGVVVKVIRILENNVGQFLQVNRMDGGSQLSRVGRLVARKTIFLDEQNVDLTQWRTFAVDLSELIVPEPGAIYRVELSFDQDLSIYQCPDDDFIPRSKEDILAADKAEFEKEMQTYNVSPDRSYYYYDDYDYYYYEDEYDYYYYDDGYDPCERWFWYYARTKASKNVLATDLGLIAMRGTDETMLVSVHSIKTTQPIRGVEITVHNYQGQLLGKGSTDGQGHAHIKMGEGRPFYIKASKGQQRSYLRIDNGASLSMSNFDVSGDVVQKGVKGFIYGERGVWRPGDTMFLSFMLNDSKGRIPDNHPVTMELYSPTGQLYLRKVRNQGQMGVYAFEMPTDADAPTGAWTAKVTVGGLTFSKRLRVESIKPNRLKIDLNLGTMLRRGQAMNGSLHTEWLQGATTRNLRYEIEASFSRMRTTFDKYANYIFDDPSRQIDSEMSTVFSGNTDEKGNATLNQVIDFGRSAPGMLAADFITRVYEESGDFSIDGKTMKYSPHRRYVGISSPQSNREHLHTDNEYRYDIVLLSEDGQPVANQEVQIEIYKVEWYWWWSSDNSSLANYVSRSSNKPIEKVSRKVGSDGKTNFRFKVPEDKWGTYFIRVTDVNGTHTTGVMNYFDWPYLQGRRNTDGSSASNLLTFKTDKDHYEPGEEVKVTFPSEEGSRAILTVENGSRVLSISEVNGQKGETTVKLKATAEMQPNVYIHIILLQPHATTLNDLPIRLYGVVPISVTSKDSYLHPQVKAPDEIKPESKYEVTVSEKNGRPMAYTLAIVDEGLLDLTRFATPDPWKAFNAREALGVSTWDMYNQIVGAYGGRIEQLFSIGGDDDAGGGPKATVNRFKPVVEFAGPFTLKKGEKKHHSFDMPNYSGRVRVMVVAGDGSAYGNTDKSVMVRKPLMLLGTLPRVIGTSEEMYVPATVFATEDNIGQVNVKIECSGNMEIVGQTTQTINFREKTDKQVLFRIRTKENAGAGHVKITATGGGDRSVYETDIEIRSVRRPVTEVMATTIKGGENWSHTAQMPGAAGTNSLTLEVSDVQPINLSSRLSYLIGYPHGCLEQITSKSFPQLYLKGLVSLSPKQEATAEEAVRQTLAKYRSYQMPEGSLAYWPGGTSTYSWATNYATHFMVEAEKKGYLVPENVKDGALRNLALVARNWKYNGSSSYSNSERMSQAYRLYVLALAGKAEIGAMNRLNEVLTNSNPANYFLAASYALAGREDVAGEILSKTKYASVEYGQYDQTFGSELRDKSIVLITMCLLNRADEAWVLANEISAQLSKDNWYSTQTTAFALMAMSQYIDKYRTGDSLSFTYSHSGTSENVSTTKSVWSRQLVENHSRSLPVQVKNDTEGTLYARIITEGTPDQGEESAYNNILTIDVAYLDGQGKKIDITELQQGTNFTAQVTISNPSRRAYNNLVLSQIVPAGWEIMNTRFLSLSSTSEAAEGISYQDIRDDRVYTYVDHFPAGRKVTVKLNLSAVYAGEFYLPPVYADLMYDNLVRANTEGLRVKVVQQ